MLDGSGLRVYRYVSIQKPAGRIFYQRESRKASRTPRIYFPRHLKPGTDEFDEAYKRVHRGEQPAQPTDDRPKLERAGNNTLRWLIERFYGSPVWEALDAKTTQPKRRRILDGICQEKHEATGLLYADLPLADLHEGHVAKLRDLKKAAPGTANERVKAMRAVCGWGSDKKSFPGQTPLLPRNPAAEVDYMTTNSDGHRAWEETDAETYCSVYALGMMERLCFDLLIYTGARVSDIARMGLPSIVKTDEGDELHFTEYKGRNKGKPKHHKMPLLAALRESIDAYYAQNQIVAPTFLTTQSREPFEEHYLSQRFAVWCKRAGISAGLTAHGVRKLSAIMMALNGATVPEMMRFFGWRKPEQAMFYVEQAESRLLERKAGKRLAERRETKILRMVR